MKRKLKEILSDERLRGLYPCTEETKVPASLVLVTIRLGPDLYGWLQDCARHDLFSSSVEAQIARTLRHRKEFEERQLMELENPEPDGESGGRHDPDDPLDDEIPF